MSKKKMAVVFDGLGYGGIERVGVQFVNIFLDLGYDVDVINLQPDKNEMEGEFPDKAHIISGGKFFYLIPEIYMAGVKRWSIGKYVYPIIYALTKGLMLVERFFRRRKEKYDIGVAFAGHFRDLSYVAYNFVRSEKKICWLHGGLIGYLTLSSTYGDMYRKIRNLVVLSELYQELALDNNAYLKHEVFIDKIYNPIRVNDVEVDEEFVMRLQAEYGDFFLMVGRFEGDKDQKTVIRAIRVLKDDYHMTPNMVFVGDGSKLDECRAYALEMEVEDQVIFMGGRSDVNNFYAAAKLFIHSSPAEGLPTVLLEAMKFSLPIVATNSPPGVEEILQSGKYGVQCNIGDAEDMAQRVHAILTDDQLYQKYSQGSIECLKTFRYETICEKTKHKLETLQ